MERSNGSGSMQTMKRNEYKVKDFDDIAWAYLDIPSWWIRKEKEE